MNAPTATRPADAAASRNGPAGETGSDDARTPGSSASSAARTLALLLWLPLAGLVSAGASPEALQAQSGEWPSLKDAGFWSNESGSVQLALSGYAFLDGFMPSDSAPGLMRANTSFIAPRVRLFADLFLGERFLITAEGRLDRGHAPADRDFEVRMEQLYAQAGPFGFLTLTAGRFTSPFGLWPEQHLSEQDPFIRPPLPYDHPTVLSKGEIPADNLDFISWREMGGEMRATGLPPIWDAAYPIGAMAEAAGGPFVLRVAALSSAPGEDPASWNWDPDRFSEPNLTVTGTWYARADLRLSAYYSAGPYLRVEEGMGMGPGGMDEGSYNQTIQGIGAVYTRGGTTVRAEYFEDEWELPNLNYKPKETAWTAEIQQDLTAGLYVAARYGQIDFSRFRVAEGDYREWDDDANRIQVASGYRLARNAGLVAEWLMSSSNAQVEAAEDMLSLRLWWGF